MKCKILVVDDEETMRRSLADILRLEGYQVQAVSNGASALDSLRREAFDLMILDLKMPGMDGLEVMRQTVQISPDTLIILLTAHGSLESAIEALRHEAFDYLMKPATPEQILKSVQGAFIRRTDARQKQELLDELDSSIQRLRGSRRKEVPVFTGDQTQVISLTAGVLVDLSRREVSQGELRVILTPTEGKLMSVFLENRNQVLKHQELVLRVQGYETSDWEAAEVLRPLISRLRQKLATFPGGEHWIASVRGTGYVLNI